MLWDCKVRSKKAELEEEVGRASKEGQRGPGNFMSFFVNVHLLYDAINLLLYKQELLQAKEKLKEVGTDEKLQGQQTCDGSK